MRQPHSEPWVKLFRVYLWETILCNRIYRVVKWLNAILYKTESFPSKKICDATCGWKIWPLFSIMLIHVI